MRHKGRLNLNDPSGTRTTTYRTTGQRNNSDRKSGYNEARHPDAWMIGHPGKGTPDTWHLPNIEHWTPRWWATVVLRLEHRTVDRVDRGLSRPPMIVVGLSFRDLCNCVQPTLPVCFGRDAKSRWSRLPGVYARGSKRPHARKWKYPVVDSQSWRSRAINSLLPPSLTVINSLGSVSSSSLYRGLWRCTLYIIKVLLYPSAPLF